MWNRQNIRRIILRAYCDLRLRAAVAGALAFAWWGLLYPELCFTENTCEQITIVNGEEIEVEEADYRDILGASGDEIVVGSRLLEWFKQKTGRK